MEDRAEIRRLHRSEQVPIKEISRRLGIARNSVRTALASDRAPQDGGRRLTSLVDAVESELRKLLAQFPQMPAKVLAGRIGWKYSTTPLKDRVRLIMPEYVSVDPADRINSFPGDIAQCDLWFPKPRVMVCHGQRAISPVLVMTLGVSKYLATVMLPTGRQGISWRGCGNSLVGSAKLLKR